MFKDTTQFINFFSRGYQIIPQCLEYNLPTLYNNCYVPCTHYVHWSFLFDTASTPIKFYSLKLCTVLLQISTTTRVNRICPQMWYCWAPLKRVSSSWNDNFIENRQSQSPLTSVYLLLSSSSSSSSSEMKSLQYYFSHVSAAERFS
jgi:hypothetical protein